MKIAICDDEKVFVDMLVEYITPYKETYPSIDVTTYFSGEEILEAYSEGEKVDIIFFDIKMAQIDGITVAQKIRIEDENVIIFFATSHTDFVPEAFRLGAFQFFSKPVKKEDFDKDFERAIKKYELSKKVYEVKFKNETYVFFYQDIYYIESIGRHLELCDGNSKVKYIGNISELEKTFEKYNFVRCHQSFIVNMRYIKGVGKEELFLTNGESIPISRRMRIKVLDKFNKYIAGGGL